MTAHHCPDFLGAIDRVVFHEEGGGGGSAYIIGPSHNIYLIRYCPFCGEDLTPQGNADRMAAWEGKANDA